MQGPIDKSAVGWHMMSEGQGQLAFEHDDVYEREILQTKGVSQVLEMEQGSYGACWGYLENDEQMVID